MISVSIITVVFNAERTIRDAILSLQNQVYPSIEHIIIDGGSSDGTVGIISEYGHIKKFLSETDDGIYDAMNKGIRWATGDIIGILNSDDLYFDNNVIYNIVKKFNSDITVEVVYGNLIYVANNDVSKKIRLWRTSKYHKNFFNHGNVPPHPTLFVRNDVYDKVGMFDLKYKLAADYELMLRIFKIHKLKSAHIDSILVRMRLGGATNNNLKNIWKGNIEIVKAWRSNNLKLPFYFFPVRVLKRILQFFL